jgi:hypothetical protein
MPFALSHAHTHTLSLLSSQADGTMVLERLDRHGQAVQDESSIMRRWALYIKTETGIMASNWRHSSLGLTKVLATVMLQLKQDAPPFI